VQRRVEKAKDLWRRGRKTLVAKQIDGKTGTDKSFESNRGRKDLLKKLDSARPVGMVISGEKETRDGGRRVSQHKTNTSEGSLGKTKKDERTEDNKKPGCCASGSVRGGGQKRRWASAVGK